MTYRWKKNLEAVQLPGNMVISEGVIHQKGSWLVFEAEVYIGCFDDKEFRDRTEPVRARRASKPAPVEEKPKRGRPRGMKPLLVTDGATPPLDQTEAPVGN